MSENEESKGLPAKQNGDRPPLVGGGRIQAIVPQDIEQAHRLAVAIAQADMAPRSYDRNPNKIMVGIMHGMEVGMPPLAALQGIAVINGQPAIWGDAMLGLVEGAGLLEDIEERIEGEGDARVAVCEIRRKGRKTPIRRTFSVDDAKLADLWNKKGPWTQYPNRMLQMRARSFALRDGFPSVLRGLHIAEEAQDMPHIGPERAKDITPPRPARSNYQPEHPGLKPEPEPDEEDIEGGYYLVDGAGEIMGEYRTAEEFIFDFRAYMAGQLRPAEKSAMAANNIEAVRAIADEGVIEIGEFMREIAGLGVSWNGAEPAAETKPEPEQKKALTYRLLEPGGRIVLKTKSAEKWLVAFWEMMDEAATQDAAEALYRANKGPVVEMMEAGAASFDDWRSNCKQVIGQKPESAPDDAAEPAGGEAAFSLVDVDGSHIASYDAPAPFLGALDAAVREMINAKQLPKPLWDANRPTIDAILMLDSAEQAEWSDRLMAIQRVAFRGK